MKNFTLLLVFILVAAFSQAQVVFNWTPEIIGSDNNLQKMSIAGSEAVIAGYGNNFLKSTDNGTTWANVNLFNPAFTFLDINLKGNVGYIISNREVLYDATPDVYANGVILKTTDGGATWASIDITGMGTGDDPASNPNAKPSYGLDFQSVCTVNDTIVYCSLRWFEYKLSGTAISHSGVFKSTNGGATWINVSGDLVSSIVTSIVFNGENGLIAGNKLFYKTTTSLDTMTNIFANLNSGGNGYISDITLINDNEYYLTTTGDSVFYTTNGGTSFGKFKVSGGIKGGWDLFKVNDSTFVLGGNSNKNVVSADNGLTWKNLGIAAAIWEIPGVVNDSLWLLAKSAIYKVAVAELAGSTFHPVVQPLGAENLQKAAIIDSNTAIVVGNGGSFFKTVDKGSSWSDVSMPANPALETMLKDVDFCDMSQKGNETYVAFNRFPLADYASGDDLYWSGGLLVSTDNWVTYTDVDMAKIGAADAADPAKNPYHASCNGVNPSWIEYLGNNKILVWARWYDYSSTEKAEHSRIFRSIDGGKNWVALADTFPKNKYVNAMESAGDTVYVGGNTILLKSTDGGVTFTSIYANLDAGEDDAMFVNSIRIYGDQVFISTSGDGNFISNDGGATFAKTSTAGGAADFYKIDDNSFIFLGGSGKSMFTNDGGGTWQACHPGVSIFEVGGIYNNRLYALAGKGTIYSVSIADLALSAPEINLPGTGGLSVTYKAASTELVSLVKNIDRCRVYSLTGQLLSDQAPRSNKCEFKNGSFMPGIYVVSSLVDGKVYTNKVYLK